MSRFWAGGNTRDSDSDSGSESGEEQPQARQPVGGGRFGYDESESESEDEVRVVKSQKDRAFSAIQERVIKIKNFWKNGDWPGIQSEFMEANQKIDRSKMLIAKYGLPKFYVKMLAEVEDYLNLTLKDKESFKKMKQTVKQAVDRMKLTVRKHNKLFEKEIADFRAHPDNYADSDEDGSDDDDEDDESESSSDGSSQVGGKMNVKDDAEEDESDSDSSTFVEEEDSDDEDSEEELKGRAKWLKKEISKVKPEEVKRKVKTVGKNDVQVNISVDKPKLWHLDDDMKEEILDRKIVELMASRGRKGTDPRDMLRRLEVLSKVARRFGPRKEIPVLMHLVSAMYDGHRNIDDYMELEQWRTCFRCLIRITQLLDSNHSIILGVMPTEDVTDLVLAPLIKLKKANGEDVYEPISKIDDDGKGPLKVVGSLESFIARLEDEYTKSLQQINPHTQDYVTRLSDEALLVELAEYIYSYYRRIGDEKAAAIVALLHVEHLYYKHDSVAVAVQRAYLFNKTWGKYGDLHPGCMGRIDAAAVRNNVSIFHPASFIGSPTVNPTPLDTGSKLEELSLFIFKHGDERAKTRALLCSVYHHSLHDRYHRARDLFLMSHIQDTIDKADTKTQILYNRALVTLGLAAFRLGLVQKAHDCLAGICSGRVKELLAQGQTRWYERDAEQEKVERRRQIPYHMHINPDLLDACHLICAMFLELPHMTKSNQSNATVVSKQFRKHMQTYNRQVFSGPPENIREHILSSAKALLAGDWQKACDYLLGLEVWNLIPSDGGGQVKEMLRERVKEEAIRTYLLAYGQHYESISLGHLCAMFDMEEIPARRTISRMIFRKEIAAAWEFPAETLAIYSVEPTSIQTLSTQVAEKLSALVESNERMIDPFVNVYGYKDSYGYKDDWGGRNDSRKFDPSERKRYPGWKSSKPNPVRQQGRVSGRTNSRSGGRVWAAGKTSGRSTYGADSKTPSNDQPLRKSGWGSGL